MKFLDWYLSETFENEEFEHNRLRGILSLLKDCPRHASRKEYLKYLLMNGLNDFTEALKEAWSIFESRLDISQEKDIPEHLKDKLST